MSCVAAAVLWPFRGASHQAASQQCGNAAPHRCHSSHQFPGLPLRGAVGAKAVRWAHKESHEQCRFKSGRLAAETPLMYAQCCTLSHCLRSCTRCDTLRCYVRAPPPSHSGKKPGSRTPPYHTPRRPHLCSRHGAYAPRREPAMRTFYPLARALIDTATACKQMHQR